jgi:hypothetical protein
MAKRPAPKPAAGKPSAVQAQAGCVCDAVRLEIDVPALWAWHDHSQSSRHAHGAAYATYVGSWRSRFRMLQGEGILTRFEEPQTGAVRSFCSRCGTPVLYERPRSPKVVNIPRALFETRTGREPRYHVASQEMADWTWLGEPMAPLKGYPGVMWVRPRKTKPRVVDELFEP